MAFDTLEKVHEINSACSFDDLSKVWSTITKDLGYANSSVMLMDWSGGGRVQVLRCCHDLPDCYVDEYLDEEFFQFDLGANPLACSGKSISQHMSGFSMAGKPDRVVDFVDFVGRLKTPGEVAVPIEMGSLRRVVFGAYSNEVARLFNAQLREHAATFERLAAIAANKYAHLELLGGDPISGALKPQEETCLHHLAAGMTHNRIAQIEGVTVKAIDARIQKLKRKFGCHNQAHLVAKAVQIGLVKVST